MPALNNIVDILANETNYSEAKSGKYKDQQQFNYFSEKYQSDLVGYCLDNEKNVSKLKTAIKTYELAGKLLENQLFQQHNNFVDYTLRLFNMNNKIHTKFAAVGDEENKFYELQETRFSPTANNMKQDPVLFMDGIDFGKVSFARCEAIKGAIGERNVYLLQYPGYINEMSNNLSEVITDLNKHRSHHLRLGGDIRKVLESDEHSVVTNIRLSNGVFYGRSVDSALVGLLERGNKDAAEELSKLRVVNVGIQPLWDIKGGKEGSHPAEITIYSSVDMFAPASRYIEGIDRQFATGGFDKPYKIFSNPDNPNRICVYLGPDAVVNVIEKGDKKLANVGSHQMEHYFASVGIHPTQKAVVEELNKLGQEIIKPFMDGSADIKQQNLTQRLQSAGFEVEVLSKEKYRDMHKSEAYENGNLEYQRMIAEQIAKEFVVRNDHPLLKLSTENMRFVNGGR